MKLLTMTTPAHLSPAELTTELPAQLLAQLPAQLPVRTHRIKSC